MWYCHCNRCGYEGYTSYVHNYHSWPAPDGHYYGFLCHRCLLKLEAEQAERHRLELVPKYSE